MTSFRTVVYEPAHRAGLFELMDDVWGSYVSDEEFDWWFERNPAGPKLITLAEDGGRMAGVGAMSPFRMSLGGQERIAVAAVHMATHPDFRGRGIFQAVELANEERAAEGGAALAIGFTNREAGPIYVSRLGWTDVVRPRLWARLLRPLAAVRRASGRGGGGDGLRTPQAGPREYGTLRVEPIARLGPEADELCARAAAGYPDHFVRDAAFLNWRYADASKDYRCFAALREGRLNGLAVVGHKLHSGISAGFVADLIVPPKATAETRALVRRCLAEVKGGADALVMLPPAVRAQRRALALLGFLPTPMRLRVIAKPLDPAVRLPEAGREWYFTLGDTDIF